MMTDLDIVIEICGSAGEGTISAGEILARYMSEEGFEIISFDSYPAEIRGFGKCVAHTRISEFKVHSPGKYADVLIVLNDAHSISQLSNLKQDGIVIYDSKPPGYHEEDKSIAGWLEPGMTSYGIPLFNLANRAAGNARGRNMVALGAFAALFGIDDKGFTESIKKRYKKKKQIVVDSNVKSFMEGYSWTRENISKMDNCTFECAVPGSSSQRQIITGNQAVVNGALAAGLSFYAGYPITPATKIMELLSKELPKGWGVLLQAEDEIAAIGSVVGAGYAGKRAMTATSGPGFSLMTEFAGLSVMAEVPAVIINSQRGGPSTGVPTKTEQSDLKMAIHGGTGDCPRIVLAPSNVEECFTATVLSLYFAEKYQTLVVLLMDGFLSNSIRNIETPAPPDPKYLSSNIPPTPSDLKEYKRYKVTESGISPRAIPGTPGGMCFSTGLEHDEYGKPQYDGETHRMMTDKRHRKIEGTLEEAPDPVITGNVKEARIGIVSWGSSAGAAHEAAETALRNGMNVAAFSSMLISPLPEEALRDFCSGCDKILVPELNYTGQFGDMVTLATGKPVEKLNIISGLPMASEDILEKVRQMSE